MVNDRGDTLITRVGKRESKADGGQRRRQKRRTRKGNEEEGEEGDGGKEEEEEVPRGYIRCDHFIVSVFTMSLDDFIPSKTEIFVVQK